MKNLFLVLFTLLLTSAFAQMPNTADSIYWTPKFCNTSETVEDCYEAYTYNANIGCYMAGTYGTAMCDQLFPEIWLFDSYDCCCKVASTPGVVGAWTFFYGSPCQSYLDSIGFIYDDPGYVNSVMLDEIDLELNGIYIDMYGRQYIAPPKGISIMNRKTYIRFN